MKLSNLIIAVAIISISVLFLKNNASAFAQTAPAAVAASLAETVTDSIETEAAPTINMADAMRSNGKIWVVVAVLVTILIGLFIYLFTIDKKISSVEKNLDSSKQ